MALKKDFVLGIFFVLHINQLGASIKLVKIKERLSSQKQLLENAQTQFPFDSRKKLLKVLQKKSDEIQQSDTYSNIKKLHSEVAFENQIKKLQSCYACFFYCSDDGKAIVESLKPYL